MDYGDSTMNQALSIEKIFSEFFLNVKAILRRVGVSGSQHVGPKEQSIILAIENAKQLVRNALLDDFDTPEAISVLMNLVRELNRYMDSAGAAAASLSSAVLSSGAKYITSILKIFGLIPDNNEIGFALDANGGNGVAENKEELLTPYLDALTNFRETVRLAAMSMSLPLLPSPPSSSLSPSCSHSLTFPLLSCSSPVLSCPVAVGGDSQAVLAAADTLRDVILPDLGVRIEEKGSGSETTSVWKLCDPEAMRLEREQKEAAKLEKEKQKAEARRKAQEKEEKAKIPPEELFRSQVDLYSEFNENGFPVKDAKGEPLSKGMIKKLEKEMEKQREAHAKYLEKK
jgi:cysteinyl-tRNA synthetase